MKIDPFKHRTRSMPLTGIRLTAAEKKLADALSWKLAGIPDDLLVVMRAALADQILHLDDVFEWTEDGSEPAQVRREQQERTVLMWQAVDWAYIRSDARAEMAAQGGRS